MRRALSESRIVHLVLLALPFVAVIVAWSWLRHGFPTYQYGDERTHYQVVRDVAHIWPRAILWGYQAWSGPFVYWLLATLSLPFGGSLVATRLVVAALSWGTCAVAYVILRDRLGTRPRDALGLSLLLALSPFFFGQSFRVLTDNPTWFFVALALERLLAYVREPKMRRLVAFAAFAAIATTMRQPAAWLFVPAAVALAAARLPARRSLAHEPVAAFDFVARQAGVRRLAKASLAMPIRKGFAGSAAQSCHDCSTPFTSAQIAWFNGVGTPCSYPKRTIPPLR